MTPMDPKVKKQWLIALRSGDIRQVKKKLGNIRGDRCCLGVLCDLAVSANVVPSPSPVTIDDRKRLMFYGETEFLPSDVVKWANLPDYDPDIIDKNGKASTLGTLNDSGVSFSEIADLIEAQY